MVALSKKEKKNQILTDPETWSHRKWCDVSKRSNRVLIHVSEKCDGQRAHSHYLVIQITSKIGVSLKK